MGGRIDPSHPARPRPPQRAGQPVAQRVGDRSRLRRQSGEGDGARQPAFDTIDPDGPVQPIEAAAQRLRRGGIIGGAEDELDRAVADTADLRIVDGRADPLRAIGQGRAGDVEAHSVAEPAEAVEAHDREIGLRCAPLRQPPFDHRHQPLAAVRARVTATAAGPDGHQQGGGGDGRPQEERHGHGHTLAGDV
jgi:hypothetical protein